MILWLSIYCDFSTKKVLPTPVGWNHLQSVYAAAVWEGITTLWSCCTPTDDTPSNKNGSYVGEDPLLHLR